MFALAALATPTLAQRTVDVWTATLSPKIVSNHPQIYALGCFNLSNLAGTVRCSSTNTLSEDEFTHDSTDYTVTHVALVAPHSPSGGNLAFRLNVGRALNNSFTLIVDGTSFPLADALGTGTNNMTWRSTSLSWTVGTDVSVRLTGPDTNDPPMFSATTADRSVAENTAAGQDVGAVLTATDTDGDMPTNTLEGADAASFDIVTTSGSAQIRTKTGVTYNHEARPTYTVMVKADDGKGGADTVTVTITVTDVNEPPGVPAAPSVAATSGSTTSLDVTWTAPSNTGPAITSYDLQYREGASGNFTDGPQGVTGLSAAIGSLMPDTSHEVQGARHQRRGRRRLVVCGDRADRRPRPLGGW